MLRVNPLNITQEAPLFTEVVGAPASAKLDVPLKYQVQTNWCWAACAEMIGAHFMISLVQCQLANWLHSQRNCCRHGSSPACNQPSRIDDIKILYAHHGIYTKFNLGERTFDEIKYDISLGAPIEVGFAWFGGGGHVAVLYGWSEINGKQYVHIHDPWPATGTKTITLEELKSGYGRGTWKWVWYDFGPNISGV